MQSLRILTDDKGAGLGQRRITVSTSGLVPKLEKLGERGACGRTSRCRSTRRTTRSATQIMPINRKWNIGKLLAALRAYPLEQRRRITFEYVLLAGVNDRARRTRRSSRSCCAACKCKVNIIPWNPHPEAPYQRPAPR